MSTREAKTITVREALGDGYPGAVVRKTGKSMNEWHEEFNRRLVADVERGSLNPDRWFLPSQVTGLATRYGFAEDDDLIFSLMPVKLLQKDYPKIEPRVSPTTHNVAEYMLVARINPEKYGHLAGIYGSKKIRRIL